MKTLKFVTSGISGSEDMGRLETRNKELKKAHDELKRRVDERTIQLKQTNAHLQTEIAGRKYTTELLKKLSNAVQQTEDMVLITDKNGIIEFAIHCLTDKQG